MSANEPKVREGKVLIVSQFNTGFMLGVEFGVRQAEKGHNLQHTLLDAYKILCPEEAPNGE